MKFWVIAVYVQDANRTYINAREDNVTKGILATIANSPPIQDRAAFVGIGLPDRKSYRILCSRFLYLRFEYTQ